MRAFKNFKKYEINTRSEEEQYLVSVGVSFIKTEDDVDWYECQKNLSDDTLKIVYHPSTKVVREVTKDKSTLFPIDMSLAEVDEYPKNFDKQKDFSGFTFDEEKHEIVERVYSVDEIKSQVENQKSTLISEVMTLINPLQFAKDLDMATDEEKERLKNLQKYVVLLNRVSIQESYPTGVVWPEIPTT